VIGAESKDPEDGWIYDSALRCSHQNPRENSLKRHGGGNIFGSFDSPSRLLRIAQDDTLKEFHANRANYKFSRPC
jgi:hypothetical protein